jgi:hypothetical protein
LNDDFTCPECGENDPRTNPRTLEDGREVCRDCYYTINFYKLFGYDTDTKVFVDAFISNKKENFINIAILDFVEMEFRAITRKSVETSLHKAKYEAILRVCELVDDFSNVTVYTHFKTVENQVEGIHSAKKLGKQLFYLKKYLKKGLKLKFIDEEFNYAKITPHMFKIFHAFENYNRTMFLQKG